MTNRFTAMSVPGDRDDGADTGWHLYDRQAGRGVRKIGDGAAARAESTRLAAASSRAGKAVRS